MALFPAENLSYELWDTIAFYSVATDISFLGPPSILCSLTLVSRRLHDYLCIENNSHLYARIFRFKFDTIAPTRRLSERWRTTKCLASELVKRFKALKRIKALELDVDDAWTAYLMCVSKYLSFFEEGNLCHYFEHLGCPKTMERTRHSYCTMLNSKNGSKR